MLTDQRKSEMIANSMQTAIGTVDRELIDFDCTLKMGRFQLNRLNCLISRLDV